MNAHIKAPKRTIRCAPKIFEPGISAGWGSGKGGDRDHDPLYIPKAEHPDGSALDVAYDQSDQHRGNMDSIPRVKKT